MSEVVFKVFSTFGWVLIACMLIMVVSAWLYSNLREDEVNKELERALFYSIIASTLVGLCSLFILIALIFV